MGVEVGGVEGIEIVLPVSHIAILTIIMFNSQMRQRSRG